MFLLCQNAARFAPQSKANRTENINFYLRRKLGLQRLLSVLLGNDGLLDDLLHGLLASNALTDKGQTS